MCVSLSGRILRLKLHRLMCLKMPKQLLCWSYNENMCYWLPRSFSIICRSKHFSLRFYVPKYILWRLCILEMFRKLPRYIFWIQIRCWATLRLRMSKSLLCLHSNNKLCTKLWAKIIWRSCYQNMQKLSFNLSNLPFINSMHDLHFRIIFVIWSMHEHLHFEQWSR